MKSKLKDIDETNTEVEYHFFPIEPYPHKTCYFFFTPRSMHGNYCNSKRKVFYQHYMSIQGFLIHKKVLYNPFELSNKLSLYMDDK